MLVILSQCRSKDTSAVEFAKSWEALGASLEPLRKCLEKQKEAKETVKETDFDCPNHYAKLAYKAGYKEALDLVISLLPESSKG